MLSSTERLTNLPEYRLFASDLVPQCKPILNLEAESADVYQVALLDAALMKKVEIEVGQTVDRTISNYDEYHDGRWKILSLINSTGDSHDTTLADSHEGVATEILEGMPNTLALLEKSFVISSVVSARIVRFESDGNLWEHADLTPMDGQVTVPVRYHIPVITSRGAVFVSNGYRSHMAPGHLWAIRNITQPHGATNEGQVDRIHLMIDYRGPILNAHHKPYLDNGNIQELPKLTYADQEKISERAAAIIKMGDIALAEKGIQALFFRAQLPGISTHELITRVYENLGPDWQDKIEEWQKKNLLFMQGKDSA